jgi:hypothetical protein
VGFPSRFPRFPKNTVKQDFNLKAWRKFVTTAVYHRPGLATTRISGEFEASQGGPVLAPAKKHRPAPAARCGQPTVFAGAAAPKELDETVEYEPR